MSDKRFEQGPIRPPSEAGSLLFRFTRNCPWNRCTFCPVYKGTQFSRRSLKEIMEDIDTAAEIYQQLRDFSSALSPAWRISAPVATISTSCAIAASVPAMRRITVPRIGHTGALFGRSGSSNTEPAPRRSQAGWAAH